MLKDFPNKQRVKEFAEGPEQDRRNRWAAAAREAAKHLAPADVPIERGDPARLADLVAEYNSLQARSKEILTAILMSCFEPGGPIRVEFGGSAWSNVTTAQREDLAVNRFVDPYVNYITRIA